MTQPVGIYPSPISNPTPWDTFWVQGSVWQGKIRVVGAVAAFRWDIKDPPGANGEIQTYRGIRTKPFRVEFYLWTDLHFAYWPAFSLNFMYPTSKLGVTPAVVVYHPALMMIGIGAVIIDDVGAVEPVGDDKMFKAVVTMRQFIPPLPINTTNTPPGASAVSPPAVPGVPVNPAIAALEARIAALQQQASNLGTPGGLP